MLEFAQNGQYDFMFNAFSHNEIEMRYLSGMFQDVPLVFP